jgi:putative DNA primase/helicase
MTEDEIRNGTDTGSHEPHGGAQGEKIRRQVEERVQKEAEAQAGATPGGKAGENGKVKSQFVRDCLRANELGDGCLYAALLRGRYLYDKSSGTWLRWAGHHWGPDIRAESLAAVERVAQRYLQEARDIVDLIDWATQNDDKDQVRKLRKTQMQIYRRVSRLRTEHGRTVTLKFAHTNISDPMDVLGEQLDQDPWLLACANGVIDLRTGIPRAGRPEDLLTKASPVEFKGLKEPAPEWKKALLEIMDGDKKMVAFLQRLLGYAITGSTRDNVLPVLHGRGRNGKTTIVEIMKEVMGDGLVSPIQSEMLLDQVRARSSAGPSPDIMALRGLRMAYASETDEHRRFSAAKVKWLSGSDSLTGRRPHDRHQTTFRSTHKLFLFTNHKPHAPAHDYSFWERLHLVKFPLSFVARAPREDRERRTDPDLMKKLTGELPGILAWLVRGCLQWQSQGLAPPEQVKKATLEYQREEDTLADFIEECCQLDPEERVGASELYAAFETWWQDNVSSDPKRTPKQRAFGNWMTQRRVERRKIQGTIYYLGIRLLLDWEKEVDQEDREH